ncbi:uncharacterized protein BDW70DRAFT_93373 [Aspergillus foveolatus]|uniref:uncharacterized protein n=1 Tax=Aspergillus foveolatus TaxID=210207 RepID=UPI003CCD2590
MVPILILFSRLSCSVSCAVYVMPQYCYARYLSLSIMTSVALSGYNTYAQFILVHWTSD